MKNYKYLTLIIILVASAALRFYNLMHDYPYFFNPDERNMASAITRFRLPSDVTQIPICLINQFSRNSLTEDQRPPASPGTGRATTNDCNLNPHFFAYGQFPLYLAYTSDQATSVILNSFQHLIGIPKQDGYRTVTRQVRDDMLVTSFPSAIYWLRFWSALSSTFTVLLIYLITKELFKNVQTRFVLARQAGYIAALGTAFAPGLIQAAHFGTTESLLTFFFMASIYFSIQLLNSKHEGMYQTVRPEARNSKQIQNRISDFGFRILALSAVIGFSLGSKLTGIFFFVPPLIAILIKIIKSKNIFGYLKIGLLVFIGSIVFFILSSPYNLIEPENFQSAVFGYETNVATGKYEAFYTRQFVDSLPILFQAEKIFPFVLGWPVFILGSLGFLVITSKLLLWFILFTQAKIQNSIPIKSGQNYKSKVKIISLFNFKLYFYIFTFSFLIYFIPNAFLFAKWTRFMTPILPFFAIFAAFVISKIQKLNNSFAYLLICLFVIASILPGLMFMSVYTHEDTRIQASRWIYENIPNNSYILSETANVVDIPLSLTGGARSGSPKSGVPAVGDFGAVERQDPSSKGYTVISFDFYHLDENPLLFEDLLNHLEKADYILIPSRRIFANYPKLPQKFPIVTRYYQLLFSGNLGFEKVKEIKVLSDEQAEETFTVFDHPVIRIYQKIKPLTKDEYTSILKV